MNKGALLGLGAIMGLGAVIGTLELILLRRPKVFDPWSYDRDGNGKIDAGEVLEAANDCLQGKITEAERDQVAALWQSGEVMPGFGSFTVAIVNYSELLKNSQESAKTYGKPLPAQWYAQVPSIVLDPVSQVPLNYLQPTGAGTYRPLDEVCQMVITEEMAGYSPYWHPEGKPPATKLVIAAGPLRGEVVEGYQLWEYGIVFESSLIELTPDCRLQYDYGRNKISQVG
jgi:hypothetical protein